MGFEHQRIRLFNCIPDLCALKCLQMSNVKRFPASAEFEQRHLEMAAHVAFINEHLPEIVPFINELLDSGMIDGLLSITYTGPVRSSIGLGNSGVCPNRSFDSREMLKPTGVTLPHGLRPYVRAEPRNATQDDTSPTK